MRSGLSELNCTQLKRDCLHPHSHWRGFTLVEMAVVLVIMGLVMLTVFPALTTMRASNAKALTISNQRSLMLAVAAYVQANGCLPCPTNPNIGNTPGGSATFGLVGTSGNKACGACAKPQGIAPFVSLGIPQSTALDGWMHWMTMRVDPNLTNPTASPLVACAANYNALCADGSKSAGISSATAGVQVITPGGSSQYAAVIFISHGATGYGSYMAQAAPNSNYGSPILFPSTSTYPPCSPPVGYAQCNSAHNTLTKVYNAPEVVGAADPSDDILTFASRNILVSMFGNASCPTNCNW